MRVFLKFSVVNYEQNRKSSIYLQADGMYFVLQTPTNPWKANEQNVQEWNGLTLEEAIKKVIP